MKILKIFLISSGLCLSLQTQAEQEVTREFQVTGIVKKLENDVVVLRVKERNIRLSKRFFESQNQLAEGEIATAHYPMTFRTSGSRSPSNE